MKHLRINYPLIKKVAVGGLLVVAVFSLGGYSMNISGNQSPTVGTTPSQPPTEDRLMAGNLPLPGEELDQAKDVFISSSKKITKEGREMIRYVNTSNDAIPLTTEALRFALIEAILGNYDPVKDAISRLDQGKLMLQGIQPPIEAMALHRMSISLLEEYRTLLSAVITIPRDQFDSSQLEDDFSRLNGLWGIANTELRAIKQRHAISLFPKAITFYGEVLGAGQQ